MDYNDLSIDVRYISINKEDKDLGIKVNTVGFQTINSNKNNIYCDQSNNKKTNSITFIIEISL